jgi:hypothetical protein
MKTNSWKFSSKLVVALAALAAFTVQAQTNAPSTNAAPSLFGGLSEIWTALTSSSGTNVDLGGQTNWAAIPYISYDLTDKKWGYGGAVLYAVTPNFWAGVRAEEMNGMQITAGVQAQLQVSQTILGVRVTEFLEASTGLGKSSLYGSAGPGGLINFHTWIWGKKSLTVGIVGDYEHCIMGGKNWNQANVGPLLRFSF